MPGSHFGLAVKEVAELSTVFSVLSIQQPSSAFAPLFFGILSSASVSRWPPILMNSTLLAFGFVYRWRNSR